MRRKITPEVVWAAVKCAIKFAQDTALWILVSTAVVYLVTPVGGRLWQIVSFLPPMIYIILCVRNRRLAPDYDSLYEHYIQMLAAALIVGLLTYLEKISWGMPLALVTAGSMIFLLRVLRQEQGGEVDGRSIGLNILLLGGILAAALILGSPTVLNLGAGILKGILRFTLVPLVYLVAIVIGGGLYLIISLFRYAMHLETQPLPELTMITDTAQMLGIETIESTPAGWLTMAFRILGAVIFLIAVILIFRYFYRTTTRIGEKNKGGVTITRGRIAEGNAPARESIFSFLDRSPEARVRRAFAGSLKPLYQLHRLKAGDTSADAMLNFPAEHREDAMALRELYLRARYTEHGGLTAADAKQAENLAKKM